MSTALKIDDLLAARYLQRGKSIPHLLPGISPWGIDALKGRLVAVPKMSLGAALTSVVHVLADAQKQLETAAWIIGKHSCFYPPDAARWGVDLDAVAIVQLSNEKDMWFAADKLIRSGGIGLVVLDLESLGPKRETQGILSLQNRLARLARTYNVAVIILLGMQSAEDTGAPVSLTVKSTVSPTSSPGRYTVCVAPKRDKSGTSHWKIEELCDAPDGMY